MGPEAKSIDQTLKRIERRLTAFAYQKLSVTGAVRQALTIPQGAEFAKLRLESSTETGVVVRYLEHAGNSVSISDGIGLCHLDYFEIDGSDSLANLRVIAVSGTHTLHIEYFK